MKTYSFTEIKGCTLDASGVEQLHLYRWYEQNGVYYPVILQNDVDSVWDFVVEYYEGYTASGIIAENDDLQKIVDGEIDEGSCAEDLYNEIKEEIRVEFGKTLDEETLEAETEKEAQKRLSESNEYIYAKAIEGYLKQLKG